MNTTIRNLMLVGAGMFVVTALTVGEAYASGGDSNFSSIAQNITKSIQDLPKLLSGLAYMFGILLAVLGVMKIKDHVENPGQTPLKDGSIRLAAGGALFAIPMVSNAMLNTIGSETAVSAPTLKTIDWN